MSYRENMAVYELSGKGEIPLNGKVGKVSEKKGGNLCVSNDSNISNFLSEEYKKNMSFGTKNIYIKKVHLQLGAILRKYDIDPNADQYPSNFDPDLVNYLGNDEFSDSYLLDIHPNEINVLKDLKILIEGNGFPTKVEWGDKYSQLSHIDI